MLPTKPKNIGTEAGALLTGVVHPRMMFVDRQVRPDPRRRHHTEGDPPLTTDNDLINQFVELNPNRPDLDDVRLRGFGVPVWAVVGYWLGYDGDVDRAARDDGVPREAVEAALEYYREQKQLIDARIQANEIAVAS